MFLVKGPGGAMAECCVGSLNAARIARLQVLS